MAFASSMSVSVECVNVCNLPKGDGSGRYDCSILSCAWKAPRVLTGFLASTANPPQCSLLSSVRNGRRTRANFRSESSTDGGWLGSETSDLALGNRIRSSLVRAACKRWQLCCSSSLTYDAFDEISPERLWEDLRPTISYLSPKELELVHNDMI